MFCLFSSWIDWLTITQLDPTTKIRLAYGGRVYSDHEALEAHPYWAFSNDSVVSGFVFQ